MHQIFQSQIDLTSTNRRIGLAFISSSAAFLLLNFFEPFGLYHNDDIPGNQVFVELLVAITFAFSVLIVSQLIFRPLMKQYRSSVLQLIGWFMIEAGLTAAIWTTLDTLTKSIGSMAAIWLDNFFAYIAIMFLPYFMYMYFIYTKDRFSAIDNSKTGAEDDHEMIPFRDDSGDIKLLIEIDKILLIKSADNYIEVYFVENDVPCKKLIRYSIKKLEEDLNNPSIMRCHRSFMINTKKILKAEKTSSGFNLRMSLLPDQTIPVSKSYVSELKKKSGLNIFE